MGLDGFDDNYQTDLDNPILLEGVDYWQRLVEDTFPPAAATWNFLEHLEYFRNGRLASAELWPEGVMTAEDPAGRAVGNVGYATFPRWEGNLADLPIGRSFLGGGGILMFDTPRSEEAFKFLQWVYEENAIEFTKRTAMFARNDQFENEEILASADFYETFLPAFGEQMAYGFPRQDIAEWGAVMYTPVGEFAADVISGVMTPEAAQQRLVNNMNTVFREEGYID
ncbi:MAG: extracellular solute-binding protein [Spirochaetaceae bacterium]|nr:MAG: extracellular solute-binding protein [Spirochaetaceae bacterium]